MTDKQMDIDKSPARELNKRQEPLHW